MGALRLVAESCSEDVVSLQAGRTPVPANGPPELVLQLPPPAGSHVPLVSLQAAAKAVWACE